MLIDCKPDSVVEDNHLSCFAIASEILALYLLRLATKRLEVAPGGVCTVHTLLYARVGSYPTISPLLIKAVCFCCALRPAYAESLPRREARRQALPVTLFVVSGLSSLLWAIIHPSAFIWYRKNAICQSWRLAYNALHETV